MADIISENIINSFYKRIRKLMDEGANSDHSSVKKELDRIRKINGNKLPQTIIELVNESR